MSRARSRTLCPVTARSAAPGWAGETLPSRRGPWRRRVYSATAVVTLLFTALSPAAASEWEFAWRHPLPQGNALGGAAFLDNQTGWAVGNLGTVVRTTDGGASWTLGEQFAQFAVDLEDLVVLGPEQLLAVGAAPGIFRSVDGGVSWQAVPNPSTARLIDLEFISGSVLSAVGEGGQALRSGDGGATWTLLASPGGQLREQFWWDAANGYVVGLFQARRTTDGGQSWQPLSGVPDNDVYNEVFFTDAQHGFILSDFMMYTTVNGGATWSGDFTGQFVYHGNTVVLSPQHFLAVTNLEGAFIFETTNAGATWDPILITGTDGFLDFDRLDDGTLIAVGNEGDVYRSTDDGQTWSDRIEGVEPPRNVVGALAVLPGGRGCAGTTGTPNVQWYQSSNEGATWSLDPSGPAIAFTREIVFWDAQRGITAGDHGFIWRSTNGGASWSSVALPGNPNNGAAWHVTLPAPGVAFAAVAGQTQALIYRTTDFGASWHARSAGIPLNGGLTSVSFPTPEIGFACGYVGGSPRMYRTTDAGASWNAAGTSGLTGFPWDLHFQDGQIGLTTISNPPGGIFRTTNGGVSWQNVWPEPISDLVFSDTLHGGATPNQFLPDGTIVVTEDGGSTWESLQLPATRGGTSIFAVSDGFFVGGTGGVILSAFRSDPAGVPGAQTPRPDTGPAGGLVLRSLRSVGPRIEVRFELSQAGPADLSVFDARGRRIAVLARGEFPGAAAVTSLWDGSRLDGGRAPDGVYFIRLAAGREVRAIKVVLSR